MRSNVIRSAIVAAALLTAAPPCVVAQESAEDKAKRPEIAYRTELPKDDARVAKLKRDALRAVDSMSTLTQQMVDMLFSFGELGFHEVETSRYLTDVLEKNGFTVQ